RRTRRRPHEAARAARAARSAPRIPLTYVHLLLLNWLAMQAGLAVHRLTKYYAAIPAIRDLSLALPPGTILGLLGPNGSGKSTTVSILAGLREPSTGEVRFDGADISDHLVDFKARVGYVPEEANLYPFLSGREQLDLIGRLRRLPGAVRTRK